MRTPKIPAGRTADAPAAAAGGVTGHAARQAAGRVAGPGGRLRGAARVLSRHWLMGVLLLAGLSLRVLAQVAYRPALFYIDSTKYLYHAHGNDPVGYRAPLRLVLLAGHLDAVAAVQHVLGLAMALVTYLVLLRRGCPRWLAALAAAPVLLDAYQLQIEQTIMPDVWFEALVVAGLALLLWRPRAPWWMTGAGGIALGLSATVAQVGEVLVLPAVAYVLAVGGGWRRALGQAGLLCAVFALPVLAYMSTAAAVTGHFWLSNAGTGGLYGRAAAAADCATLRVPASQRPMCPTAAQKAALGDDGLLHSPASPVRRYYAQLPPAEASHTVAAFTRAVFTQQPLRVAAAIARDAVKLFAVRRAASPGDTPISRWQFQDSYPFYSPHATPPEVRAAIAQFGGGGPAVTAPLAGLLRGYQLDGGYTPGPLFAVAVLAGLAGSLSLAVPRRAGLRRTNPGPYGPGPRHLGPDSPRHPGPEGTGDRRPGRGEHSPGSREPALACLLFFLAGAAVLLVSDVLEFSWRYQLPALVTLVPAGAFGLVVLADRIRSRRDDTAGRGTT